MVKKLAIIIFVLMFLPAMGFAASFYLSPSSATCQAGQSFNASVLINTDNPVNASQAEVFFPTDKIRVLSISKAGSIFNLWVQEPVFSNTNGVVSFGGGLPSPGYAGSSGRVITITFRCLSQGQAKIDFRKEIITANDAWGTNVFSSSKPGIYTIVASDIVPPAYEVIDNEPPSDFEITVDNEGDSTNPFVFLYFETTDDIAMSHYELIVGEETLRLNSGETMPYRLDNLLPGDYDILVRAYDKAGNMTESSAGFRIDSIGAPNITIYPEVFNPNQELFYVGGTALENSAVTIFLKKGQTILSWQTTSDDSGNWFLTEGIMVRSGNYFLSARTQDIRGAISDLYQELEIRVAWGVFGFGPWFISYKTLSIFFLVLLIAVLIATLHFVKKSFREKEYIKREADDLRRKFYKEYNEVQSLIKEELSLIKGEKEQEQKLLKELNDIEEVFRKELKDIDKI